MDERRHINEHCMMGFSHCGPVFSSRNTCFVAYSFQQTLSEIDFFKKTLAEMSIEPVTARERETLEMAGTYIESLTVVKDSQVDKDEILALAAGVLKAEGLITE